MGLGVNAGHDLNRDNLADFLRAVPGVQEVSIGHALIADALELGYAETVREYQRCIQRAATRAGASRRDLRHRHRHLRHPPHRSARCSAAANASPRRCSARTRWTSSARAARGSPARGMRYLATRFSAKEAFSKAIGLGMRMPMTWRACEIVNARSGKPEIRLHGELAAWFDGARAVAHVTVTDETDYAAAFVVVETRAPTP